MESLLLHGGGGGGGQLHAEVSNPMEFTVFSTPADCSCVLVFRADPCWNVSICRGFCASRSEQQGFACFQKAFFSGRSNPMVFTFLCTPVDCSCALCIKSRKAWFLRCVGWFSGGVLSTRSFELRCPFFTSCVGELLCQCGVGGWGGVMCGTNKQGIAYCADLYSA